jgi:hypothetical protein
MKTQLTILFLIIFISTFGQTNQEVEYIKTRNNFINYFKSLASTTHSNSDWSKLDKQMDSSFMILEVRLKDIMKFSHVNDISENGKISLGSLLEGDLGFGNLDGLLFNKDSLQIFVTSNFLFNEYFKYERINPTDNLTPKQLDNILTSALGGGDARIETLFVEKKSSTTSSTVYHIIGGFGQEDVILMGKCIFILAIEKDYIYIVWNFISLEELQVCKSIYDKIYSDSQQYFEKYRASNLNDTTSLNKSFAIQEEARDKYCECYQKNFIGDRQYVNVEKQLEKIVKYIEK